MHFDSADMGDLSIALFKQADQLKTEALPKLNAMRAEEFDAGTVRQVLIDLSENQRPIVEVLASLLAYAAQTADRVAALEAALQRLEDDLDG